LLKVSVFPVYKTKHLILKGIPLSMIDTFMVIKIESIVRYDHTSLYIDIMVFEFWGISGEFKKKVELYIPTVSQHIGSLGMCIPSDVKYGNG